MLLIRCRCMMRCQDHQQHLDLSPYRRWRDWDWCGEDKRRCNPMSWWTSAEFDMIGTTVRRQAVFPVVLLTQLHSHHRIYLRAKYSITIDMKTDKYWEAARSKPLKNWPPVFLFRIKWKGRKINRHTDNTKCAQSTNENKKVSQANKSRTFLRYTQ